MTGEPKRPTASSISALLRRAGHLRAVHESLLMAVTTAGYRVWKASGGDVRVCWVAETRADGMRTDDVLAVEQREGRKALKAYAETLRAAGWDVLEHSLSRHPAPGELPVLAVSAPRFTEAGEPQ